MAQKSSPACSHRRSTPYVCSIIPPQLLQTILDNDDTSAETKAAVQKTYNHVCKLHSARQTREGFAHGTVHAHVVGTAGESNTDDANNDPPAPHHRAPPRRSIIPPKIFQAMEESEETSSEQKERARSSLQQIQNLHDSRAVADRGKAAPKAPTIYRSLYTSSKTDKLRKTLLFNEGATTAQISKDVSAKEVYEYFGDTWTFYNDIFSRNSIDNKGLHLIGSVHYDDEPGPPGMDNAFWDGSQMAFGDGDGEIFGSFTKNIDVIGHELTHGVTQYTADLEYEYQSGALNESISDVFGSMIKQYFHADGKQKAEDADWLIGEGIFLPSLKNAVALRSMKAPGTAYDNPKIGKDDQPSTMDGYVDLPNTAAGDSGGVHTNSGIPNHAFYLVATGLGGYSWEKAGKIWYASLLDKKLQGINTKTAFKVFADLTVGYALSLFDKETQDVVRKVWTDIKVLTAGTGDDEPKTGDGEL
ncbi:putative protease prtS [Bisporella sp. PMI_857]|nr:putative protease prtS [Bisporella sp. PMI_857]